MLSPHTGLIIAASVICGWIITQIYALNFHTLSIISTPMLLVALHQLYVAMFITAHDAIHGTVAPKNPWLNRAIGTTCLVLYAGFDYDMVAAEHRLHHKNAGRVGLDPDFHSGVPKLLPWSFSFLLNYTNAPQWGRLVLQEIVLAALGVPLSRLILFMAVPGLTSAAVLFYYGTYLPHRPLSGHVERPEKFGTLEPGENRLTSFLKACNFGCHEEHHANPKIPWWALFDAHKMAAAGGCRRD